MTQSRNAHDNREARPVEPPKLEHIRPFRASQINIEPCSARVEGQIPPWLRGELVRTCPGVFDLPQWKAEHWFDGLGLIFTFKFHEQGVSLRCRQLDSRASRLAVAGENPYATFDTKIKRSGLKRIFEPVPRATDNANVNIVSYGDEWVALTETPFPVIVDKNDLSTKGYVSFADSYPERCIMTAHPHFDFSRGKVVNALVYIGAFSYIAFYEHDGSGRKREEIARIHFQKLPYIHSFAMTPQHIILVSHPFRAFGPRFLWSNQGFIEAFNWNPQDGTDIYVFDRSSRKWSVYETEALFTFHLAHAFEQKGELVLDLVAHPDPSFIFTYRTESLRQQLPILRGQLQRLRMQLGQKTSSLETITKLGMEFPSVAYKRTQGKAARWVWGAGTMGEAETYRSTLIANDVISGRTTTYSETDIIFGEPVFVGKPGTDDEANGVIIAVGTHLHKDRSVCVVLDAASFKPIARVEVDYALPLGFHGSFFADTV